MITLALGTFQVSQKYLGLLPGGGSYTVKVLLINAHAEKNRLHTGKDGWSQADNKHLLIWKIKKLSYDLLIKCTFLD